MGFSQFCQSSTPIAAGWPESMEEHANESWHLDAVSDLQPTPYLGDTNDGRRCFADYNRVDAGAFVDSDRPTVCTSIGPQPDRGDEEAGVSPKISKLSRAWTASTSSSKLNTADHNQPRARRRALAARSHANTYLTIAFRAEETSGVQRKIEIRSPTFPLYLFRLEHRVGANTQFASKMHIRVQLGGWRREPSLVAQCAGSCDLVGYNQYRLRFVGSSVHIVQNSRPVCGYASSGTVDFHASIECCQIVLSCVCLTNWAKYNVARCQILFAVRTIGASRTSPFGQSSSCAVEFFVATEDTGH